MNKEKIRFFRNLICGDKDGLLYFTREHFYLTMYFFKVYVKGRAFFVWLSWVVRFFLPLRGDIRIYKINKRNKKK